MKKTSKGISICDILFYGVLIFVSIYGLISAYNVYEHPSKVGVLKPGLLTVQIIGVFLADIFILVDLKKNHKNTNKIVWYTIINVIYFMFVFIFDGDPIFNKKFIIGLDRYWWFDIFELIDFICIAAIYFYIVYLIKLENENKLEEQENKDKKILEENVENIVKEEAVQNEESVLLKKDTTKIKKAFFINALIAFISAVLVIGGTDFWLAWVCFFLSPLVAGVIGLIYMIKFF